MDTAFEWIMSNGGITTEEQWPYTSSQGAVPACSSMSVTNVPGSTPSTYSDVQPNSVSAMMSAVAQQPVSIAIEANSQSFQYYTSGVLSTDCGQQLDHGVLAVGYGSENGQDYWLVKNSWGSSWGDNGYVKILRSSANVCGVLSAPSYPVL
jgi:C1A family cysteine protease